MKCPKCLTVYEGERCPNCGYMIPDSLSLQTHSPLEQSKQFKQPNVIINNYVTGDQIQTFQHVSRNRLSRKPTESPKSKWLAFWLCVFFGEFGVHRFYVGKIGMGLLWLFTFGVFGIGWIVDCIIILFGEFKDSDNLKLKT